MKKLTLLPFFILILNISFAQKTEVRYGSAFLGGNENLVTVVEIENADMKDTRKMWSDYLKKSKGKLSTEGDEYFLDNAKIKSISEDTLDIYSTIKSAGRSVVITMAVNSNGVFINNQGGTQQAVDNYLIDFAIMVKKDLINKELSIAKKALGSKGTALSNIEKQNKKLEKANASMKNKISDNERTISNNNTKLKSENKDIEVQKSIVKELEQKIKNVE